MKKITLIALLLCSFTILFAQAPQKMSYQSVIRKADGALVTNTSVNIKVSILQGSSSGTASYVETQTTITNTNGLATIEIGGGTPVTGTFTGINWATGTYFIKTETDPAGGTNYTISGTSQLLSVPYALYAGSSQNKGKTTIVITGNITNAEAAAQIAAEVGPYTENIFIGNTTGLTIVDLSGITNVLDFDITDNTDLITVNLSSLKTIHSGAFIYGNKAITSISFPQLTSIAGGGGVFISDNTALTSISFPLLTNSGEVNIRYNPAMSSINFPLLTNILKEFYIDNNSSLTSIDLPSLASIGIAFNLSDNAIPSSQINTILHKMLSVAPATGKTIVLNSQTPPAPPTGQGIIDKTTLINTGNSVTTD